MRKTVSVLTLNENDNLNMEIDWLSETLRKLLTAQKDAIMFSRNSQIDVIFSRLTSLENRRDALRSDEPHPSRVRGMRGLNQTEMEC